MPQAQKGTQDMAVRAAVTLVKGTGVAFALCLLLLALSAGLISSGMAVEEWSQGFALASAFFGSFGGGLCASAMLGKRVLAVGAGVGLGQFLLWGLTGLIPAIDGAGETVVLALVCLLGGALSGLLTAMTKGKKRR